MEDTIKILFVEDVLADAELNWRELKKGGIEFSKLLVDNRKDYLEGLDSFKPDIIISDYSLPQFDGKSALMLRNELAPLTPFIIVTGAINEEVAVECMKAGANDYIIKEHLKRLPYAVKEVLEQYRMLIEKNASELILKENEEKIQSIYRAAPLGIGLVMNRVFMEINDTFCAITGYNRSELIGKNTEMIYPSNEEYKIAGTEKYRQINEKGFGSVETRFKCKDGTILDILLSSAPLVKDDPSKGVTFTVLDITERKMGEEELLHSYMFNDSLLKTIPFGMDIVDETGTILFQSDNLKSLFGKDGTGKKCWDLYRDDKKQCLDCPLIRGIKIGETETYESHGVLGGRVFEISHTGMIYNGKIAMLEIFLDITERKKNELELIAAKEKAEENDKLKTAFLHNISHEIRTPMNAIVGFAALLGESETDEETRKSYIDQVVQGSNHLLSIITDIIDISNIEANIVKIAKHVINVNARVSSLCDQYAPKVQKKNIELSFESGIEGNDAIIITDNVKLIQIISNLLNNAIKFTDKGYIKVGCELKGKVLEFTVADTGIGISAEHHLKIFDRFYQVEISESRIYEGTGLGLAISKANVELLGGKIWLTSEPGVGTTFHFTIPYEKPVMETPGADEKTRAEGFSFPVKKTILVAEDVDSNFHLISYYLSDANINIIRAVNGKEAVEKFQTSEKIDLILMDIKMPVMDGYTAVKLIREQNPSIPIIAQTAYVDDRKKTLETGCNGFISKPFDKKRLIKTICEYLI